MKFIPQALAGVFIIEPHLLTDERGAFARTFCKKEFEQYIGHTKEFIQMNHSWNRRRGTLRGLHYQNAPFREIKLVRCIKGWVLDVIVDVREGSPTLLKHLSVELSEENKKMIYIPEGFAHGFQTLSDDAELAYLHTEYFTPGADSGLNYKDPVLNIHWPLQVSVISEKDKNNKLIDHTFKGI
jgi:dTDP-4-dehydrorhamnose 3,5-epimerase